MHTSPSSGPLHRLERLRLAMRVENLDALVVTHLPNIRYLTGFAGTAGVLVVKAADAVLIADFRYAAAVRSLFAARPDVASAVALVVPENSYDETLIAQLQRSGARRIGIEAASMAVSRFNRLSSALAGFTAPPLNLPETCPVLVATERMVEKLRAVKDADEVRTLREAAHRLAAVAEHVPSLAVAGRSELDIAGDIDRLLRGAGFERPAFETIVASGPNSALPHARPGRRVLQPGDAVVLDFGGVYDGYCVDLTRTVELGRGVPEFRRIFDAVAEAQSAAIGRVRPGVLASEVDSAARETLARHGLREAFGHGTGHGLGLEVHEEPRIGRVAAGHADEPLEPGMVFTVEPGAYVEGFAGARIEDDVLVTADGCEVLTRP
jgi:Xaa-Pro aminopeptidase